MNLSLVKYLLKEETQPTCLLDNIELFFITGYARKNGIILPLSLSKIISDYNLKEPIYYKKK